MIETWGFGSSEPEFEFELSGFWSAWLDLSEPELEPTGFGDWGELEKGSKQSQGVKPFSKDWNGLLAIGSTDGKMAETVDNMAIEIAK